MNMNFLRTNREPAEHWIESQLGKQPGIATKESPLPKGEGQGERKTRSITKRRFLTFATLAALILICTLAFVRGDNATSNYTVHEWGTFTSVQGGDGQLLQWRPLQSSELPGFVYDWSKAGLNRGVQQTGFKGTLVTLQRMETPVMYFYADLPMSVDVNVAFPQGYITEWYPQATQIGPTYARDPNRPTNSILHDSRAIWNHLQITAPSENDEKILPQDKSGSHYFAAREPHSDFIRTDSALSTSNTSELEKFIFYRGAGSFATPLHVTVDSNNRVTVENTGSNTLAHLFLINIRDGFGYLAAMDELPASNSVPWQRVTTDSADHWNRFPLREFQTEIAGQMQAALTGEGLFPDEAKAMVDTWKDSWFTEEGVRILYILPRAWTDGILPLTLTPQPKELTRVMVGRAEVIMPDAVNSLSQTLTQAAAGDTAAGAQARHQLKTLGRFASPALQLVGAKDPNQTATRFAYQLLNPSPATNPNSFE
jgi:hypothetical protein